MNDVYRPGSVLDELGLFPLGEAVLFPGALLPLHVFEPRYRALTADALAGSQRMSVAFISGRESIDEHGHPPIASIAGVGEIVGHRKLPDGRYDIVLQGKARVALEELPFRGPYRRARATVLASHAEVSQADVAGLITVSTRFAAELRRQNPMLEIALPSGAENPATVVDLYAHQLVIDAAERQQLLETLDAAERVRRCTEIIAVQQALLGARATAPS